MQSQFGEAISLTETLNELIALAQHLRAMPADIPSKLTRLEGLTKLLNYFTMMPTRESEGWPISNNAHCSNTTCNRTWRDHDACLLNFAPINEPPVWFCREHHPALKDGGVRPAGWTHDNTTRNEKEAHTKEALNKLTAPERSAINSRI